MNVRPGNPRVEGSRVGEGGSYPAKVDPAALPLALIAFERTAPNHPSERDHKAALVRERFGMSLRRYERLLHKAAWDPKAIAADWFTCRTIQADVPRLVGHLRVIA